VLFLCWLVLAAAHPVHAAEAHPPQAPDADPFMPAAELGQPPDSMNPEPCDPAAVPAAKSRIAIIIDDMGMQHHIDEQLLALELNLTFAFLPYGPHTREIEERAWAAGHDVLVHMPMEPKDPRWDPGPDALYVSDSYARLSEAVEKNLARVPHAVGVNNHMGSLFTGDRLAMHQFLDLIRQRGMFFIDSGTSVESIGLREAREMGIKSARRHVFLDNAQNLKDICRRLQELVGVARDQGWAVGIGHANAATVDALRRCRGMLRENAELVGIQELIDAVGDGEAAEVCLEQPLE
jgi:hypothetical protein